MTIRTRTNECLKCHGDLDAASCVNDDAAKPKAGDISICIYCGNLAAFGEGLTLRELNAEERAWCEKSGVVKRVSQARDAVSPVHPDRKTLQ